MPTAAPQTILGAVHWPAGRSGGGEPGDRIQERVKTPMVRNGVIPGAAFLLAILLHGGAPGVAAQEPLPGPVTPPPNREVKRIPANSIPEPPPVPVEEIIRRFAQKEDEFLRARAGYIYRKTIRVQEFGEDNKPAGEFQVATDLIVAADGRRYEHIVQQSPSTLRRMKLAPEDLEILARMPMFALTSEQLGKYELTYQGKQQVDELTTYIFRVQPRQRERTRAYFEGLVWVDDRDFLIVKTYGKWVTEIGDVASPELPFTMYETYRENIDKKYWFPTYARSDDTLRQKNGDVRIRLTIRWADYKLPGGAPATPGADSPKPASPPAQTPTAAKQPNPQ